MNAYLQMDAAARAAELKQQQQRYDGFVAQGLKLNMARGKPAPAQLDLSAQLLSQLPAACPSWPADASGEDARNYGGLAGTPEARELLAQILGVPAANVIAAGNSSLTLMHDMVARSLLLGVRGSTPWCRLDKVAFLCPAPGYDRHFAITAGLGITNIPVAMTPAGPEMDTVERLVASDASIKGIWCVPKYSNPQGITYSDQVVQRLAALRPAAPDFRIFWDNAYAVHDLVPGQGDELADLKTACEAAGNPDLWYMFASTSKITWAGGGVAALASSQDNLAEILKQMGLATIGPDKVNQLRHVAFLGNLDGVRAQMARQAAIIAPKFAVVQDTLARELDGLGVAQWTRPRGGYFISFDGLPHTAQRCVALAKAAGVVLTNAGATWPYGKDPQDANIRIAPTYPSLAELEVASELFCVCARIAALEVLIKDSEK